MEKKFIYLGIAAAILLFAILLPVGAYNSFVSKDLEVQSTFSELQSQYQRQADLIPNLVNVVGSFARFEASLLQNITALRSAWAQAKTPAEADRIGSETTSAISRLLLVAENYPDIKSSEQYTGLRDELAGTQNRITVARGRWIKAIGEYNLATKTFPNNFFASLFGFVPKEFFAAEPEVFKTPVIEGQGLP